MGDPVRRVEAWLEKQGYPLEYQVARMLRAQRMFAVEQGRHWWDTDPRTAQRKARELDVVATRQGEKVIVRLIVECKHIPEPWVIFQREDGQTSSFDDSVTRLMASQAARNELANWYKNSRPPWHLEPSAAFKIVDTREDRKPRPGTDETSAFDVVTALIRGAWALHQSTPAGMSAVTFPVLVVQGDLVTLSYDSAGDRQLAETGFARVTWSGTILPGPGEYVRPEPVTVDVLSAAYLSEFLAKSTPSVEDIFRLLEVKL